MLFPHHLVKWNFFPRPSALFTPFQTLANHRSSYKTDGHYYYYYYFYYFPIKSNYQAANQWWKGNATTVGKVEDLFLHIKYFCSYLTEALSNPAVTYVHLFLIYIYIYKYKYIYICIALKAHKGRRYTCMYICVLPWKFFEVPQACFWNQEVRQ